MHTYVSLLTYIKDNQDIDRIDESSNLNLSVMSELHHNGFINGMYIDNKSTTAIVDPVITMDGLSFLNEQNGEANSTNDWYKKPIGLIFLSVSATVLAAFIMHLLSKYNVI
jgi:hypothetical protein